ncbi:tRNA (adenosine(37)-N6)-threonylcarbamoyltransferase complex dimerization subunit type 1 TsaB [Mycoavidus sp. B2-EB]|uniref:tRNA (adenosine(37)-N6)-threonylcarbamoyltransferase complex dimerization subunit type 1 TsaB n=1 Tax=Mycoavidus sp. B2-EB TaxID=2651972 RepID=UPI00162AB991|nr:tRNA (adenosine(37)-N6)-threonylcarbamoyltransferase complex dimerization subunit type 1 TsaB [Mycoavidus sp. B2-EB]BBO59709.1 tRNA (adenosine(37)-N6)-threonylcarbamoyltransferase complex dimerization subunit type 1 TsaB [Mycoavidus sp. B2-EB]
MNHRPTILLAIDTSTEFCSVALAVSSTAQEPPQLYSRHELTGATASLRVLPMVQEVFAEAKLNLRACTALAFGAGPGSFTGLRTATGVVQGLAFALHVPVVPVSTLLACAQATRDRAGALNRVLAVLDARMNEVYWAQFEWDPEIHNWRTVQPVTLTAPNAVNFPDAPFTLAGNAADLLSAQLASVPHKVSLDPLAQPHATAIATLGLCALRAGQVVSAESAMPVYIRNKVAFTTAERAARAAHA